MQYRGMKDVLDFFTSRERIFKFFDNRHLLDWMDDKHYLKLAFRAKMGYPLDLKNPRTFNQKLQWLKLYDRKPLYTQLVDKYAVRQYIAEKIGAEYLIPLVGGPWNSADEIDFDALPEQFVLKCNHDSGGVIVCRDKSKLDVPAVKEMLQHKLGKNYYKSGREWPYKDVSPCIFAEKYMVDDSGVELKDYKWYCFNGKPRFLLITTDRATEDVPTKYTYFDMDYNMLPFYNSGPHADKPIPKPGTFAEMKQLAEKLSADMAHLRVDLYEVEGKVYFGELTFYDSSGMAFFDPPEWDETIGSWLKLPEKE